MKCDMGTLGGMSAVIAGGPAVCALMLPLGCVLCHAWVSCYLGPMPGIEPRLHAQSAREPHQGMAGTDVGALDLSQLLF